VIQKGVEMGVLIKHKKGARKVRTGINRENEVVWPDGGRTENASSPPPRKGKNIYRPCIIQIERRYGPQTSTIG